MSDARPDLDGLEWRAINSTARAGALDTGECLTIIAYARRLEAELVARDPLAMSQRINELLEDRRRLEAELSKNSLLESRLESLEAERDEFCDHLGTITRNHRAVIERAEAAERERDKFDQWNRESRALLREAERERDEARAQVKSIAKQLAWSRDDAGAIECQRDEERELRRRALMRALFYRRALREAKAMRTAIGWTVDRAIDEREKAEAEAARLRVALEPASQVISTVISRDGREPYGPNAETGMSKFAQRGEQTLTFGMGIVGNPTVPPDEELRLGPNVDREALEKAPNVIPEGYFERHPLKELRDGKWVEVKKDEGGGAGG